MTLPAGLRKTPLSFSFAALCLIGAAYCVWFLLLPNFPSQDGPVHLYYAHVLDALLWRQPTHFADFFYIKHLLPPYSLYYYALILLSRVVSLVLADRLILCGYVVSFLFGFRYLARALGPSANQATLAASVLLLNWPVCMGFVNFCLALSLGFWAVGLWLRFAGRSDVRRRAIFLFLMLVILLTHPLPLALILGFCFLDFAIRFARNRGTLPGLLPPHFLADAGTLILASTTLAYVKFFTGSRALQQPMEGGLTGLAAVRYAVRMELDEYGLSPFYAHSWLIRAYRLALLLLVPATAAWVVMQWRKSPGRTFKISDLWLLFGFLLLLAMPFLPNTINGSRNVAPRLMILGWLCPLLAASGYAMSRRAFRGFILAGALILNAVILTAAQLYIAPVAREIATIQPLSGDHAHRVALVLNDGDATESHPDGLTFHPFYWAPVHMLRLSDDAMDNAPWVDLPVIPLGALPALSAETTRSVPQLYDSSRLMADLVSSPADRESVLRDVQVLFITEPRSGNRASRLRNPFALQPSAAALPDWTCTPTSAAWLIACRRLDSSPVR